MELKVIIQAKGKIFDGRAPEIIRENLLAFMVEATQYLERRVKGRTPRRTGLGALSIHGEVINKGTTVIKGVVGHTSKYLDFVERGTGIYGPYGLSFVIRPKEKKLYFGLAPRIRSARSSRKDFPDGSCLRILSISIFRSSQKWLTIGDSKSPGE